LRLLFRGKLRFYLLGYGVGVHFVVLGGFFERVAGLRLCPGCVEKDGLDKKLSEFAFLASSIGRLPSLKSRSLECGHFEGFAWDIIDGKLGWRSDFDRFLWSVLFDFPGFTFDRMGL
jgi:hypothetical protein